MPSYSLLASYPSAKTQTYHITRYRMAKYAPPMALRWEHINGAATSVLEYASEKHW